MSRMSLHSSWPVLLLCIVGCGGAEQAPLVTGTVTLDGRPLNRATLVFSPREAADFETIVPVTDGQFAILPDSGQLSGEFDVRVEPAQPEFEEITGAMQNGQKLPLNRTRIPSVYQQDGLLTAQLAPNATTTELTFALRSSKRR